MRITHTVSAECCGICWVSRYEKEVAGWMLEHTEARHPKRFAQLVKRARKLAMSQNGCGYADDGKSKTGGWHKAQATFRRAWTIAALIEGAME